MDLSDINFGAITAQANEMVTSDTATGTPDTSSTTASATPVESQTTTVAAPLTQTETVTTPPTSGQVSPAEQKFSIDFGNGKVEQLSQAEIALKLQEAERSGLRQADYTRKTQEAARVQQEAERIRQEALSVYAQIKQREQQYNDPNAMLAEAQRRVAASQPIDPNQPMTVGQGIQMAQAIQAEFGNMQNARVVAEQEARQAAEQIVVDKLTIAEHSKSINSTLDRVYDANPVLKATVQNIPELEQIIRYKVAQMEPGSIEETLRNFELVGKQMAEHIGQQAKQQQQVAEVARAKLVTQGIEPPGGVAPQAAQKPDFTTKGGRDLDWAKLKDAALGL